MKKLIASVAVAAAVLCGASRDVRAEGGVVLGVLTCSKTGTGVTYVVHSSSPVSCEYNGVGGPSKYTGASGILFGIDLEIEQIGGMGYLVVGGTATDKNGLAGYYIGAKASITAGLGLAAQAGLVGVGNDVVLVPVGLGGQIGIGATVGLSYVDIEGAK